ncbi:hypothetical protein [Demequina lutea]|uniref:Uncharacterized protein n=1 Tax=Demequina lutea TaxID=431489 RepID=A0A7Y9Z7P0_9MICO|nr:hypothetical protein [Demequina lutea]NYI40131.1 hypothetical protein [Demequina lutea]
MKRNDDFEGALAVRTELVRSSGTGGYRAACDLLYETGLIRRVDWPRGEDGTRFADPAVLLAASRSWSSGENAIAQFASGLLGYTTSAEFGPLDFAATLEGFPTQHRETLLRVLRAMWGTKLVM